MEEKRNPGKSQVNNEKHSKESMKNLAKSHQGGNFQNLRKLESHKRLFYKLTKLAFLYLIFPTSMAYPVRTQGSQPHIVSRKGFKISIISSPF